MSRRRQSFAPYVSPTDEALHATTFGTRAVRDEADLTVAPDEPTAGEWAEAFADLVLALACGIVVAVAWSAGYWLIVGGPR